MNTLYIKLTDYPNRVDFATFFRQYNSLVSILFFQPNRYVFFENLNFYFTKTVSFGLINKIPSKR